MSGKVRTLVVVLSVCLVSLGLVFTASTQSDHVLVAQIEGPVTPAMLSYFERLINAGQVQAAEAVIIELDTPGGSVDVTQDIVQLFRGARVPVIIFVAPAGAQAASAGSVITAAGHAAVMAPETVIGAASPVDSSGADIQETLFRKISEDLKATMRNLTARRGPEAMELAQAMVEEARAVTAQEALQADFIDAIATDVPDLLRQLDGLTVTVNGQPITLQTAQATERSFGQNVIEIALHALSNPLLIGLLLTLGIQGILIEISHPGGWVAGFVGVLCLGMALYGLGTLPANWLGLGLVAVAFVLFILEVKTTATGALAVVGTLTMLAGLLVLFNSPGTPDFARISIIGAASISVVTAAFFIFIVTKAMRAQRRAPATGIEGLVGQVASVRGAFTTADPATDHYSGMVFVKGELWRAISEEAIDRGDSVVIKGVDGVTLRVKRIGDV